MRRFAFVHSVLRATSDTNKLTIEVTENSFPTNEIKNFYYFQIGRWDVELQNNQLIKLPSSKTIQAIQQIVELLDRDDMKKYNTIDLRMSDKIIVE